MLLATQRAGGDFAENAPYAAADRVSVDRKGGIGWIRPGKGGSFSNAGMDVSTAATGWWAG